jgi:hypothetical protein
MLKPYSDEATSLQLGVYEHYKGKTYKVLGVGRHSETQEEVVIYQALYGDHDYWVRPLKMFLETVELENGKVVPRFRLVDL